jgi:hypothetical protein
MADLRVGPSEAYTTLATAYAAAGAADFIDIVAPITESLTINKNIAGIKSSNGSTWTSPGSPNAKIQSGLQQTFVISGLIIAGPGYGFEVESINASCSFQLLNNVISKTTNSVIYLNVGMPSANSIVIDSNVLSASTPGQLLLTFSNQDTPNSIIIKNNFVHSMTCDYVIKNTATSTNGILVYNNTFYVGTITGFFSLGAGVTTANVKNNYLYAASYSQPGGFGESFTNWKNNAFSGSKGGTDATNLANVSAASALQNGPGGNYSTKPGGPLIDAGITTGLNTSKNGVTRPAGAAYDIGAEEVAVASSGGISDSVQGDNKETLIVGFGI